MLIGQQTEPDDCAAGDAHKLGAPCPRRRLQIVRLLANGMLDTGMPQVHGE